MDKQTKRFSRDRGIATIHGIAGSPLFTGSLQFPGASFSRFLNIIFITVAIEHGRPSNRPPIVQFTNVLGNGFCFNCLFTNLLGLGPPIADSWHIQFSVQLKNRGRVGFVIRLVIFRKKWAPELPVFKN